MVRKPLAALGALALGLALALPALATPPEGRGGGGNRGGGNDPEDPGNGPPVTAPGRSPDFTPPGLGGNPPPGHGGPNPGNAGGNGGGRDVPRGAARICGADGEEAVGPLGQAGASHVAHASFEVGEDSESDAWARMMYFWIGSSFDFVLNAHGLEPGTEWTLVARAADESGICLAAGTVNPGGQLHIADSLELESNLPEDLDPFEPTPEGEDPAGTTLQLVPTADIDCDAGTGETEDEDALSSEHDIRFVDVDEVTCPE
jgi:hypothetical protein